MQNMQAQSSVQGAEWMDGGYDSYSPHGSYENCVHEEPAHEQPTMAEDW
jgi:hypothetical protein